MDELDALIDQAMNDDAASPAAAEGAPAEAAPASAASGEPASPPPAAPPEAPASQETPAPTPSPSGTAGTEPASTATPPASTPTELELIRQELEQTRQGFTQYIAHQNQAAAQREAQAAQAAEQQRMAQLRDEWSRLSPAERAHAEAEFVIVEARKRVFAAEQDRDRVLAEQQLVRDTQAAEQAKPAAIAKIAEHFGLPKEEHYLLQDLPDPISMAMVARARSAELSRVMDTRREAVAANPALETGAAGSGAALRTPPAEFADLDALIDFTLGGVIAR